MKHKVAMVITICTLPLAFLPSANADTVKLNPCFAYVMDDWRDKPADQLHMLKIAYRESRFNQAADSGSSVGCLQVNYSAHKKWLAPIGITRPMLKVAKINAYVARILWNAQGYAPWRLTA